MAEFGVKSAKITFYAKINRRRSVTLGVTIGIRITLRVCGRSVGSQSAIGRIGVVNKSAAPVSSRCMFA